MADRIKGLTVEIGGNVTGLKKALSDVDKSLNTTQKSLKDVNKLLKLDPKNTELLTQKQNLLKKSIGDTKEKLTALKNAEKQVQQQFKEGKVSEEQYNSLKREIIATESSLKGLEGQAAETAEQLSGSADKPKSKFAQLKDKIFGAENSAKTASKGGFTVLKGALANLAAQGISKAIAGIKSLGDKFLELGVKADDLNTLSKQSGFSTEELQKMEYAADMIDVSVDDIVGAGKKLKKNMVSTSKDTIAAFETLGVKVTDSNGKLRDSTTVFYEVVSALSRVKNETERDTLAMQIFGKSADSLAGIVDDGGAALKAYGDEAERVGAVVGQNTLDSANKFNDAVDRLKATGSGLFAQIGGEIATSLAPKLEEVQQKVQDFLASDEGKQFITDVTNLIIGLVNALGTIVEWIANNKELVITVIATVTAAVIAYTAAQTAAAIATNAALWPVLAIIAAIGALIAIIVVCVKNWDTIKAAVISVWDTICKTFSAVGQWFMNYVVTPIINAFNTVKDFVFNVLKSIGNFFIGYVNGWLFAIEFLINGIINGVNWGIQKINSMLSGISDLLGYVGIKVDWQIPSVGNISLPRIPYLAKGGTVLNGSAIVGEKGPELLTAMNGKTKVTPLTENEKAVGVNGGAKFVVENFNNYDTEVDLPKLADKFDTLMARKMNRRAASYS